MKEGFVGKGNCEGTWETLTQNPSTFEEPMLRELSQENTYRGTDVRKNSASSYINCFRDETPSSLITCVRNSIINTLLAEKNCVTYTFSVERKTDFTGNMPLPSSIILPPPLNQTALD